MYLDLGMFRYLCWKTEDDLSQCESVETCGRTRAVWPEGGAAGLELPEEDEGGGLEPLLALAAAAE